MASALHADVRTGRKASRFREIPVPAVPTHPPMLESFGSARVGDYVYCIGGLAKVPNRSGERRSMAVSRYSMSTGKWSNLDAKAEGAADGPAGSKSDFGTRARIPAPRSRHAVCAIGHLVFIHGGEGASFSVRRAPADAVSASTDDQERGYDEAGAPQSPNPLDALLQTNGDGTAVRATGADLKALRRTLHSDMWVLDTRDCSWSEIKPNHAPTADDGDSNEGYDPADADTGASGAGAAQSSSGKGTTLGGSAQDEAEAKRRFGYTKATACRSDRVDAEPVATLRAADGSFRQPASLPGKGRSGSTRKVAASKRRVAGAGRTTSSHGEGTHPTADDAAGATDAPSLSQSKLKPGQSLRAIAPIGRRGHILTPWVDGMGQPWLVMCGGAGAGSRGDNTPFGDVWLFSVSGRFWKELKPRPPPRDSSGNLDSIWLSAEDVATSARNAEEGYSPGIVVPPPRASAAGTVIGDSLYVFGGASPRGAMNDLWCFDITARVWKRVHQTIPTDGPDGHVTAPSGRPALVPPQRYGHAVVPDPWDKKCLLVIGGRAPRTPEPLGASLTASRPDPTTFFSVQSGQTTRTARSLTSLQLAPTSVDSLPWRFNTESKLWAPLLVVTDPFRELKLAQKQQRDAKRKQGVDLRASSSAATAADANMRRLEAEQAAEEAARNLRRAERSFVQSRGDMRRKVSHAAFSSVRGDDDSEAAGRAGDVEGGSFADVTGGASESESARARQERLDAEEDVRPAVHGMPAPRFACLVQPMFLHPQLEKLSGRWKAVCGAIEDGAVVSGDSPSRNYGQMVDSKGSLLAVEPGLPLPVHASLRVPPSGLGGPFTAVAEQEARVKDGLVAGASLAEATIVQADCSCRRVLICGGVRTDGSGGSIPLVEAFHLLVPPPPRHGWRTKMVVDGVSADVLLGKTDQGRAMSSARVVGSVAAGKSAPEEAGLPAAVRGILTRHEAEVPTEPEIRGLGQTTAMVGVGDRRFQQREEKKKQQQQQLMMTAKMRDEAKASHSKDGTALFGRTGSVIGSGLQTFSLSSKASEGGRAGLGQLDTTGLDASGLHPRSPTGAAQSPTAASALGGSVRVIGSAESIGASFGNLSLQSLGSVKEDAETAAAVAAKWGSSAQPPVGSASTVLSDYVRPKVLRSVASLHRGAEAGGGRDGAWRWSKGPEAMDVSEELLLRASKDKDLPDRPTDSELAAAVEKAPPPRSAGATRTVIGSMTGGSAARWVSATAGEESHRQPDHPQDAMEVGLPGYGSHGHDDSHGGPQVAALPGWYGEEDTDSFTPGARGSLGGWLPPLDEAPFALHGEQDDSEGKTALGAAEGGSHRDRWLHHDDNSDDDADTVDGPPTAPVAGRSEPELQTHAPGFRPPAHIRGSLKPRLAGATDRATKAASSQPAESPQSASVHSDHDGRASRAVSLQERPRLNVPTTPQPRSRSSPHSARSAVVQGRASPMRSVTPSVNTSSVLSDQAADAEEEDDLGGRKLVSPVPFEAARQGARSATPGSRAHLDQARESGFARQSESGLVPEPHPGRRSKSPMKQLSAQEVSREAEDSAAARRDEHGSIRRRMLQLENALTPATQDVIAARQRDVELDRLTPSQRLREDSRRHGLQRAARAVAPADDPLQSLAAGHSSAQLARTLTAMQMAELSDPGLSGSLRGDAVKSLLTPAVFAPGGGTLNSALAAAEVQARRTRLDGLASSASAQALPRAGLERAGFGGSSASVAQLPRAAADGLKSSKAQRLGATAGVVASVTGSVVDSASAEALRRLKREQDRVAHSSAPGAAVGAPSSKHRRPLPLAVRAVMGRQPPSASLPPEVVRRVRARYKEETTIGSKAGLPGRAGRLGRRRHGAPSRGDWEGKEGAMMAPDRGEAPPLFVLHDQSKHSTTTALPASAVLDTFPTDTHRLRQATGGRRGATLEEVAAPIVARAVRQAKKDRDGRVPGGSVMAATLPDGSVALDYRSVTEEDTMRERVRRERSMREETRRNMTGVDVFSAGQPIVHPPKPHMPEPDESGAGSRTHLRAVMSKGLPVGSIQPDLRVLMKRAQQESCATVAELTRAKTLRQQLHNQGKRSIGKPAGGAVSNAAGKGTAAARPRLPPHLQASSAKSSKQLRERARWEEEAAAYAVTSPLFAQMESKRREKEFGSVAAGKLAHSAASVRATHVSTVPTRSSVISCRPGLVNGTGRAIKARSRAEPDMRTALVVPEEVLAARSAMHRRMTLEKNLAYTGVSVEQELGPPLSDMSATGNVTNADGDAAAGGGGFGHSAAGGVPTRIFVSAFDRPMPAPDLTRLRQSLQERKAEARRAVADRRAEAQSIAQTALQSTGGFA